MTANARQVGGTHYKIDGKGEEHWDRVHRLRLDYFQAQITKYVERCWLKNGIQDLEKAKHFLEKYLELLHTDDVRKRVDPPIERRLPYETACAAPVDETHPSSTTVGSRDYSGVPAGVEAARAFMDTHRNDGSEPQAKGYVDQDR